MKKEEIRKTVLSGLDLDIQYQNSLVWSTEGDTLQPSSRYS